MRSAVSTTLMESYRDEQGRPRQRVLANLHGEPDTLRALAKLALMHDALLQQREEEYAEPGKRGAGFVLVTARALTRHNRRIAQIDRQLDSLEREMAAIDQHCSASDDEFEKAAQRYGKEYCKLVERVMGFAVASRQAKAALRRMEK